MIKKITTAVLFSSLIAPTAMAGTNHFTAGMGSTDYELEVDGSSFTEADWKDFEGVYTYRGENGGFFNASYRTSLSAEHDTFSGNGVNYTSDLEDSRISLTMGAGPVYVGYLSYSTDLNASTEYLDAASDSSPSDISYELTGLTFGIQGHSGLSDSVNLQYGFGVLMAEADLTQINKDDSERVSYDYDLSFGYFYGVGLSGPLGSTGLAYALKYEYQTIEFDSTDVNVQVLDDTRSRISGSLTYTFL